MSPASRPTRSNGFVVGAAILMAVACGVAVSGGGRTKIGWLHLSVTRPTGLTVLASALIALDYRRRGSEATDRLWKAWRAHAPALAAAVAAATLTVALLFGAFVAAGADPYGYVTEALLWLHGNPVQWQSALGTGGPWPNAAAAFCPLGYKPSADGQLVVPTYAPGLPLQMAAAAHVAGRMGVWVVVPLLGALVVWWTYKLGQHVCGRADSAVFAAVLMASSPVFLFQLMLPLSDVPVTAWLLLAILAALDPSIRGAAGAGLCFALALAVRPNLLPLAIPLAAYVYFGPTSSSVRRGWRMTALVAGAVPGVALIAWSNVVFYGSPLLSGYGRLEEIYALRYLTTNLRQYPLWLVQSHTLFALAGVLLLPLAYAAPIPPTWRRDVITHGVLGLLFAGFVLACYIFYLPFDHWTYLRFLLPALPVLIVLAIAALDLAAAWFTPSVQNAIKVVVVMVLPLAWINFAVRGDAFRLRTLFADRYVRAGETVRSTTPADSSFLTLLQSGALRYYADRSTVRYDLIPPSDLTRAIAYLSSQHRTPYLALERTELADFRHRFGATAETLLRAPAQSVDPLGLVTIYGPLPPGTMEQGPRTTDQLRSSSRRR